MGIFINLLISKSVTKEEWEKVYGETLELIKHLPFAEGKKIKIHDIDTYCLVKSEEHPENYGWNNEKTRIGWNTIGDYLSMKTAENYFLPRDLIGNNNVELSAGDALLAAIPAYMNLELKNDPLDHTYELWGAKTQGEPYHIHLLSVAALIEARLGEKALTYGDITRGQFKRAVGIANKYLEKPIELPDRCYPDRLLKRVSKLPLEPQEQLAVFEEFFLGTKDTSFGTFMSQVYSDDVITEFWKRKFKNCKIGTTGFDNLINDYLLWGFSLRELCNYVSYDIGGEGEPDYEKFIIRIMDAKLHIENKNCADPLKIDQDEERPYGISKLFAQFIFAGAKNKKIDRYIPIGEIRATLNDALSSHCNVDKIINDYLEEEEKNIRINLDSHTTDEEIAELVKNDPAEAFNQVMDIKRKQLKEEQEKYDIDDYMYLLYYEDGDTIHPVLEKSLANSMKFLKSLLDEEEYKELITESAKRCCQWLVENNRCFRIRDTDWDRIFTSIENDIKSFGRYYSLFRAKIDNDGLLDMCIALLTNDELYSYSELLMKNMTHEE